MCFKSILCWDLHAHIMWLYSKNTNWFIANILLSWVINAKESLCFYICLFFPLVDPFKQNRKARNGPNDHNPGTNASFSSLQCRTASTSPHSYPKVKSYFHACVVSTFRRVCARMRKEAIVQTMNSPTMNTIETIEDLFRYHLIYVRTP